MYVCMCMCMCTCMHTCIRHRCPNIRVSPRSYAHVCVYMCVCVFVRMYVCMFVRVCFCRYVVIYVCIASSRVCVHTHLHKCLHAYNMLAATSPLTSRGSHAWLKIISHIYIHTNTHRHTKTHTYIHTHRNKSFDESRVACMVEDHLAYIYIYIYTHTYKNTNIHTYIHTGTNPLTSRGSHAWFKTQSRSSI